MAPQTYQLVMRSGPNPGKIFELSQNQMTIGRDITNDLVINDAEVSRKHARLTAQGGGYVLEDTGSTNGTFVNGQRLMGPHMLRPGELILFGENVSLTYEYVQYDPDATMVAVSNVPNMPPSPAPPVSQEPYAAPRPASYSPPSQVPPPAYSQAAPGPVETYAGEEDRGFNRNYILAGCGCLTVLACLLLVGGLFWIDAGGTARWCQYLGFLFSTCP